MQKDPYGFDQNLKTVNFKQCRLNVVECICAYQDHSAIIKSPATVRYQLHQVKALRRYFEGSNIKHISSIDENVINQLIVWSRTTCKNNTINKRIAFLKLVYKYYNIDFPYLLAMKKLKQDFMSYQVIKESELKALISFAKRLDDANPYQFTWKLAIFLLLDTGARVNELLTIRIINVDLENSSIKLTNTKTKKERFVFFSRTTADLLKRYIVMDPVRDLLLFNYRSYKPFCYRNVEHMFDHIKKKLKLQILHAHMFRHTMATTLVENGCPLDSVQQILGHASISTTQIYLHMSTKKAKSDFEKYSYMNTQAGQDGEDDGK